MAQPLYFLPGLFRQNAFSGERIAASTLRERGIEGIFADVAAQQTGYSEVKGQGPGGRSGTILYYQTPEGKIPPLTQYAPHRQEWHEVSELLWIGIDIDNPPTPGDMARNKVHPGYRLDVAGDAITVPIIRRPDDSTELPRDMYWDKGTPTQAIQKAYRKYWEASAEVLNWFVPDMGQIFKADQWRALTLAIDVIGINYRYGVNEHNILRWVDAQNYLNILGWSIDYVGYMELEDAKKKNSSEPIEASITPGQPDDLATTAPVEATYLPSA